MKICSKCRCAKLIDEFSFSSKIRGIRQSRCKVCCRAEHREYYRKNKARKRLYNEAYRKTNLWRYAAASSKYRASKLRATPTWLTDTQLALMQRMYENRPDGYHVDHIVPLQGDFVSGLHVPWNLQYLLASENYSKRNRLNDHPGSATITEG